MSSKLQTILNATDPSTLAFDPSAAQFVHLPSNIEAFASQPYNSEIPEAPYLTMIPKLNVDKTQATAGALEIVNSQYNVLQFVSEVPFTSGVHFFELNHLMNFKNVKIGIYRERKNGSKLDYSMNLDKAKNCTSLLLRIDMDQRKMTLLLKHINYKRELKFKGTGFYFYITLSNIGNFISFNPFVLYKGVSNVWRFNAHLLETKKFSMLKNWEFITDFKPEKFGSLQEFLKQEIIVGENETAKITNSSFDEELEILAIELNKHRHKSAAKNNKDLQFVSKSKVREALSVVYRENYPGQDDGSNKLVDFLHRHLSQLIQKNPVEVLEEVLPKFTSLNPKQIIKVSDPSTLPVSIRYLESSDSLLISNKKNKIKILKERSENGSFVVSPFIFDQNRVSVNLQLDEFKLIFKSLNWDDLIHKLTLTADEITQLKNFFLEVSNGHSIFADDQYAYLALSGKSLRVLVEKVIEYVNLSLRASSQAISDRDEDYNVEVINEDGNEEEKKVTKTIDEEEGDGLLHLFEESPEPNRMKLRKSSLKLQVQHLFKNNFDIFPSEFDGLLKTVYKLEEALYLQDSEYRNKFNQISRSHSAYNRIFSYIYSSLPMQQIEQLADSGLFINSFFLQEFKHFKFEEYAFNDFNDQNIVPQMLKGYSEGRLNSHLGIPPHENIQLEFSITHMPVTRFSGTIEKVFTPHNGKLVIVLTDDKILKVFASKIGLTQVAEINLQKPPSWSGVKLFDNLKPLTTEDNLYFLKDDTAEILKKDKEEKPADKTNADDPSLINKNMLDQLYQMGFPIELAKKVLIEVKSASLDAALNAILKYTEETPKAKETGKSKIFQLMIKPEWQCKLCTYINHIENIPDSPNMCEVCGNIADEDAFFEEAQEIEEELPSNVPQAQQVSEEKDHMMTLDLSDELVDLDIVELSKENLLHHLFLVLLIKRENTYKAIVTRLAFTEEFLRTCVAIDPKSGNLVSIFGQYLLKKGRKERDLGEIIQNFYIDKIMNIAPKFAKGHILAESARNLQNIQNMGSIDQVFGLVQSRLNERNSEIKTILFKGESGVQEWILTNKAKSYSHTEFEFEKSNFHAVSNPTKLLHFQKSLNLLVSHTAIEFFRTNVAELTGLYRTSEELTIDTLVPLTSSQLALIKSNREGEWIDLNSIDDLNQQKSLQDYLEQQQSNANASKSNEFISPKVMLSYFKSQSNVKSSLQDKQNLILMSNRTRGSRYEYHMQPTNHTSSSSFSLVTENKNEGLNLCVEAYFKVQRSNENVKQFIASQQLSEKKASNYHSNDFQKLHLKAVTFKGAHFSKNYHLSQMLLDNAEHFSTQYANNLFIFENSFERIMKIKKFTFIIPDSFKKNNTVDEVLMFVFNDLAHANMFIHYKNLTYAQYENGLKYGLFPSGFEPCLCINLKQATENSTIKAELEIEKVGKYVAFLPLISSKFSLTPNSQIFDCFEYFGVEGEYLSEKDEADILFNSSEAHKESITAQKLEGSEWSISFGDKNKVRVSNFVIQNIKETKSDCLVKTIVNIPIAGDGLSKLDFELPATKDGHQLINFSVKLLNISNSLSIEIRDQFKQGPSDKFQHFLSVYNSQIVESSTDKGTSSSTALTNKKPDGLSAAETITELLSLGELLLFAVESFGANVGTSIVRTLNLNLLLRKTILNASSPKILGIFRLIFEKLVNFDQVHDQLLTLFTSTFNELTNDIVTVDGLSTFWHLLSKFVAKANEENKKKALELVSQNLNHTLQMIKANNSNHIKLLRTFGFSETVNGLLGFGSQESTTTQVGSEQKVQKIPSDSKVDFADTAKIIDYNAFILQDKNYTEIYLNCVETIKLDSIMFKLNGILKLADFRFEVFYYCLTTEKYIQVKSKHLNEDFTNYIIGRGTNDATKNVLQSFDFGLNFSSIEAPVKLIKIVVKNNFLPNFTYREPDIIEFNPFVFGKKISELIRETNDDQLEVIKQLTSQFVSASNQQYTSVLDDLSLNNNLKPKIVEFESSSVYKLIISENKPEIDVATNNEQEDGSSSNNENKTLFDTLTVSKDSIFEYLDGLNVADTKNNQKIKAHLSNLLTNYNKTKESLIASKNAVTLPYISYDQNLSFWITNADLILKEFLNPTTLFKNDEFTLLKVVSQQDLCDFTHMLFYDLYLLDNSKHAALEKILITLPEKLSNTLLHQLMTSITDRFLNESVIVFALNTNILIDKLRNTKLLSEFKWKDQLNKLTTQLVPKFDSNPNDEFAFKEIVLANLILFSDLRGENSVQPNTFDDLLKFTIWLLKMKFPKVAKIFGESAALMINKLFTLLQPSEAYELDIAAPTIQELILLLLENNLVSVIDKVLNEFEKAVSSKSKPMPKPEYTKGLLDKISKTLMTIVREEIIEKQDGPMSKEGKIQTVLFFALNHIGYINQILCSGAKEGESEKTPLLVKPSIKKDSQHGISTSQVISKDKDNEVNFNDFVSDILNFLTNRRIEDNSIISIVTNFAINEHINQTVLFNFSKFAMNQSKDLRQTIIYDLSSRFGEIFKRIKATNNKTHLRDFATVTIDLLVHLMTNYKEELLTDVSLTHFCIKLTFPIINENEPKVIADEQCKIPLKSHVIVPLLCESINILITHFNYGGVENFHYFSQDKLNLFELISYCIHIVVKGIDESNASLLNHLIQNFKNLKDNTAEHDLSTALENVCVWLMCNVNSATPDLKSVVGPFFKKLFTDIDFLYFELMKKEECAKILLNYTCSHFKNLYSVLQNKIQAESLGYIALYMAENSIEFMEKLLKNISKNEILATYFLNQIKGLEMVFDILNKCSNLGSKNKDDIPYSPDSLIGKFHEINIGSTEEVSATDGAKNVLSANKDKSTFDEEFGNRIKNIFNDKSITNGSNIKDWHSSKSGRNTAIYSTSIQSHKKSLSLRFKATEPFELRNFKLSLTVTRSENYIVVGPSPYVHLYAILDEDQKNSTTGPRRVYLGELERLEDSGYLIFNSVVYVLNPNKINGKDYNKALDSLHYIKEITDFELVISRPLFTVVDKISPLCVKSMTAVNLSINFISIDGFSHTKVDLAASFKHKTQATLHNFLDVIFNSESFTNPLDDYFNSLNKSGNLELFKAIENQLDPIMQNFDERMSKFLMILSEKNKQMADSIFLFLMKNIQKKALFFDLIEKILKKTFSYKYLFEFVDFGKKNLVSSSADLSKFLKVVINYIVYLAQKLEGDAKESKFVLPIDQKFYKMVMSNHKSNPFVYSIERFLVVVIGFLHKGQLFTDFPAEFAKLTGSQIDASKLNQKTTELALQFIELYMQAIEQKDFVFLPHIAYLAIYCEDVKKKIIEKDLIRVALQNILENDKNVRSDVLLFLQTIVTFEDLYAIAIKEGADKLLIATLEKQITNADFKADEEQIHQLLKTIFGVYKVNQERINELEETLFSMLKSNKNDPFFIEKVFLKFFEFEMTKAVSFKLIKKPAAEISESKNELELSSANQSSSQKKIKINSSYLTMEAANKLASKLVYLVDEKTEKDIKKNDWKMIIETNDSTEDFGTKLESLCYNKKPIMIILSTECNGISGVLGLYAPEGFTECFDQTDYNAYIPNSDNVFVFYYSEDTEVHFKPEAKFCSKFLQYSTNPDNKTLSMVYDMSEKVLISMMSDISSNVDLSPMKPITQDSLPDFEFPYDVHINCLEIFQLEIKIDQKATGTESAESEDLCSKYLSKQSIVNLPYSIFESSVVYDLQGELTMRAIKDVAQLAGNWDEFKEKKLSEFSESHIVLEVIKEVPPLSKKVFENNYNPKFPLFEAFIQRGGMRYIIETIKQNDKITFLSQGNLNEIWRKVMDDLLDLEKIEGFLSSMIQNKEFLLILFELFIGGANSERNWQEAEFLVSSLMFEKLALILKNTDSIDMRIVFFEKNVLRKLLDKLKFLTNETSRVYDDTPEKVDTVVAESQVIKEESLVKEVKKRKGVGYDKEGSGKKWLVTEYLAKKKLRNEFVVHLLKLFKNLFSVNYEDLKEVQPSFKIIKESWFNEICESSLLPLMESAFKSSSLHEMAKEYEVYEQYCQILLLISSISQLKPLLKQLPSTYKPVQLESLLSILQKQEENTKLFKKFSQIENVKSNENDEKLHSIELANLIQQTIESVKSHYPEFFDDERDGADEMSNADVDKILQLSVNEQYKLAVKDLKFDLADMKKSGDSKYDHHYASNITSDSKVSSQSRMVRLAQEIADLTASLPIDSYNAITVRADVNRLDVIKAMIAGAEGTPYANGLFEYHVYLPPEYPQGSPKCNLETTGSGDVRFNPNLYSCGKVCLSLLGTWRGSASENWDPKISNLLQLFLSIQSVVMSEEVYFNEPGYEGEIGTEEGEKKNEGYSNIVRLNNIKFAMIRHITNPIKGFEDVIRRHFYIKRDVILAECSRWVKMAEVRPASYSGLVSDHNHKYASRFSNNNKNYVSDLKDAITELEKTLKELVQSHNPQHIFSSKKALNNKAKAKAKTAKVKQNKEGEVLDLEILKEKIDTTWDENVKNQVFDAEDQKVSDRWSRYIGAMGIEAVKKQAQAKVAIIGMNNLGLEIAKNIVLSGVNTLGLYDWKSILETDLLGNFYATNEDIGKNRAEVVKRKLEQLNFYVKLENYVIKEDIDFADLASKYELFIIADNFAKITSPLIAKISESKKRLIISENIGVFSRVFNDFGKEFLVNDRDGEDPSECYIKEINYSTNRITLFDKSFNQLRDGDYIVISEVETKPEDESNTSLKPLNGSIHKIKEMHKVTEIEVEDLSGFKTFARNGKIKELKVPIKHDFAPYADLNSTNIETFWDENLRHHDFLKYETTELAAKCFLFKEKFEKETGNEFAQVAFKEIQKELTDEQKADEKFIKKLQLFWITAHGRIHSMDAFIGGVVSQEAIKSITNKFTPIKQLFVTEFEELLDESLVKTPEVYTIEKIDSILKSQNKYGPIALIIGESSFEALSKTKIFMVGSGAIGCELLKNYAMIGLGSGKEGKIILTDPDSIELSNLNRQFLFREKHISKPKSLVAASVVETMNPDYKGKIHARLEKVCEESETVFNDEFFANTDICFNALDNIKARIYMDQRCVRNHVPLLESGTLGSKGHVQVILPGKTENYTQVQDANDEQNIPVCTLKMFPEEPIHCVEWAKDRFEVFFSQNPKSAVRVLEEFAKSKNVDDVDFKIQKAVLKFIERRPYSMKDSIVIALKYFYKAFHNKIRQLLHVYPLDFITKDGKLFWTLPKRPPIPLEFSTDNEVDMKFLQSFARLQARIWGIPEEFPTIEKVKEIIKGVTIEPFKPKDSASANIKQAVEKQGNEQKDNEEEDGKDDPEAVQKKMQDQKEITEKLTKLLNTLDVDALIKMVKIEVFEKDVDQNGHVDFIYSMTNQRTRNYKLPQMEWIQVKLKAGRIVPALATTTSAIAGLQTIESIKIIKKLAIEQFRNAFVNLAIPSMTLSEPGPSAVHKIREGLDVTVWDQWLYEFSDDSNNKLKNLFDFIKEKYQVIPQDLFKSNKAIFFSAIDKLENFENRTLDDLLDLEKGEYCFTNLICKLSPEDPKPLQNIPQLKIKFK